MREEARDSLSTFINSSGPDIRPNRAPTEIHRALELSETQQQILNISFTIFKKSMKVLDVLLQAGVLLSWWNDSVELAQPVNFDLVNTIGQLNRR